MTGTETTVNAAKAALADHSWEDAYESLHSIEDSLDADGFSDLAEAAWFTGRIDEALAAHEAAYRLLDERGDNARAGWEAFQLSQLYVARDDMAQASGWLGKAERQLEPIEEGPGHGLLWFTRAIRARSRGNFDEAADALRRAAAIGRESGENNLYGVATSYLGSLQIELGNVQEGLELVDEATTAAVTGELSPFLTGVVYCSTIQTNWDMADFGRAAEWTEAAQRWCDEQSIEGWPGACRVRRAEIYALRGYWGQAEREAIRAGDELRQFQQLGYTADALYQVGEIRLRLGDLEEAEQSFREAGELGREPLPGMAELQAARGETDEAINSLLHVFTEPQQRMHRARVLVPLTQLLLEAGNVEQAQQAAGELEAIAETYATPALAAWADLARAECLVASGNPQEALVAATRACRTWDDLNAPYEAARARLGRGWVRRALGDRSGAERDLQAARSMFQRLGAKRDADRAATLIAEVKKAPQEATEVHKAMMFTDIVDSTKLLDVIGDHAWTKVLGWHDRTLRSCFGRNSAERVENTGDGFFVVFSNAGAAVECAIDVQKQLELHRESSGFAPEVRIGIHVGDITEVDESPAGREVHRAARVGALAGGGEIVVTRAIADETPFEIPVPIWRKEEVKGFSAPVEVGEVDWKTG